VKLSAVLIIPSSETFSVVRKVGSRKERRKPCVQQDADGSGKGGGRRMKGKEIGGPQKRRKQITFPSLSF